MPLKGFARNGFPVMHAKDIRKLHVGLADIDQKGVDVS